MQEHFENSITFFGKGVHYNKDTRMTVIPTSSGGIVFHRTDIECEPIVAHYANVHQTQLSTTIGTKEKTVSTIEHLMAAFYYFNLKNAKIIIDGPEIPLMDGGSNDFIFGLEMLKIPERNTPKLLLKKEISVQFNDSKITAKPSENFEVSFKIEFENSPIGTQTNTFNEKKHNFKDTISYAKTFGHIAQIQQMNKLGICLGGDIFSAIVFNDTEILSPSYTHTKMDFVRHKILDFIGDLHITDFEIKGIFECYKSSHALNNALLREIFSDENNFEIIN